MSYCEDTIKKMLPKAYVRKHVAHEIYVAMTHFKNLIPMMDKYVYNDGTTKDLMSLTGTIPVLFNDKTYNIPICLWIEEIISVGLSCATTVHLLCSNHILN
uniref:UEV domain-containing protein n=1 Tax=Seriola dumerili TaxID=41447 RepID=A0A3B4V6R0_SERDU